MDLIDAILKNDTKLVKELLEQGADPNVYLDGDKIRPLHFAVQKNAVHIAELLIIYGADINAVTEPDGETAYDIAKLHDFKEILSLLKEYAHGVKKH